MKKIVFNYVPPCAANLPSPAFSILKSWLRKNGFDSSVIYWNLHLNQLQNDFVWNSSAVLGTSNNLALYVNYCVCKSKDQLYYNSLKKILQGYSPKYISYDSGFYDKHMQGFTDRMEEIIDGILAKMDFSETLLWGFSMKMDGWIVSSIIAEKIKRISPDAIILIGGINTRKNAKAFLANFPQFDIAMWGEGEEPLVELVRVIEEGKNKYDEVSNIAYRYKDSIVFSDKTNNHFVNLSESDVYPDYDDFFLQRQMLKINQNVVIPIEGSRGCHWNKCRFCYLNADYQYRLKSIDKISREIRYMIEKYKVYAFEFLDNDFIGLDIDRANDLLDSLVEIKKQEPKFKIITAEIITKGLDHATIKKMFDGGIVFAQIGYESTSQKLLAKIKKKNTFASNLFYVKIATLYNIPLYNVNVITNMPDETMEDIMEATDNLRFLRFFLHPVNFRHLLIPVQVNSISRYYSKIKQEMPLWSFSTIGYEFLKEKIDSKYYWDILTFIKETQHHQWSTFKRIEKFYFENKHTYAIRKEDTSIKYSEYNNGRILFELDFDEKSFEAKVLLCANNKVVSLNDLILKISEKGAVSNQVIINVIERLYEKGLVYRSSDYTEIVSVIHIAPDLLK